MVGHISSSEFCKINELKPLLVKFQNLILEKRIPNKLSDNAVFVIIGDFDLKLVEGAHIYPRPFNRSMISNSSSLVSISSSSSTTSLFLSV